jgi:hypothetical protein
MIGYLNITGLELALLLNFKNARLDWKRVVRRQKAAGSDVLISNPNSLSVPSA